MSSNLMKDTARAESSFVWSFVKDPSLMDRQKNYGLAFRGFSQAMKDAHSGSYDPVDNPRPEVILTARFIANMEPSYRNSKNQPVSLAYVRSLVQMTKDDRDYIIDKFYEAVKPFISVSTETAMVGLKLKVATKMSKKSLVRAALLHLFFGCELIDDEQTYMTIQESAMMAGSLRHNYGTLIGIAHALRYPNVGAMMEDFCLTFIDQEQSIEETGHLTFYDGVIHVTRV